MFGARSSVLVAFLALFVSFVAANNVCVLKPKSSCESAKYAFIEGGLKPGNAVRVSVELLPQAIFELTNAAFQNVATIRFGVNSCSIESSVASVRAYSLYKSGEYRTGSVISFDLVAQEKSISIYMAGERILELPILVAAPFMLSLSSNGKNPSLQLLDYSSTRSSFCALSQSSPCNSSNLVSLTSGVQSKIKVHSTIPVSVPQDYFTYFFSAYSNIYNLPVLEVAFTTEKWYVTSKGRFVGQGKLPLSVVSGEPLIVSLTPASDKITIEANSSSLGQFSVSPAEINFIYQSVSQGTMKVEY